MRRLSSAVLLAPLLATVDTGLANANEQCVNMRIDMTPTSSLQLVAWLEKADGTFVDTLYITAKTGTYGMGNRPGRYDFNSGPVPNPATGVDDMWPYGRRVTTFPVWAHRHGMTWPKVLFQDGADSNLSHSVGDSSPETTPPYCRPVSKDGSSQCWSSADKTIWDTGTCATRVYTDKGVFSSDETSLYPPRADLTRQSEDSASVEMYRMMNPFDAVSHATPVGGTPLAINWPVPSTLPEGDYVVWVEASKEFDSNNVYNSSMFPPPNVSYSACGLPYLGQPSVVYTVPVHISGTQSVQLTTDYVGYGDPKGDAGTLNPPDSTITTDTPGSGALRLQLTYDNGQMFRVRASNLPQTDFARPDAPAELTVTAVEPTKAMLRFVEPGDDGQIGVVSGYEVKIRANEPITDANFQDSMSVITTVNPSAPGSMQSIQLEGLLPETQYFVAVRAFDDCHNSSDLTTVELDTSERQAGTVDACFIATAAYGSLMANDVQSLRHVRDSLLSKTIFGELAIETYYTFGPAVAGVVGESDMLRATARAALGPVVAWVKRLAY